MREGAQGEGGFQSSCATLYRWQLKQHKKKEEEEEEEKEIADEALVSEKLCYSSERWKNCEYTIN